MTKEAREGDIVQEQAEWGVGLREQKVLRMKARFWKTRGIWGGEWYVAADDTRTFVPIEVEVVLGHLGRGVLPTGFVMHNSLCMCYAVCKQEDRKNSSPAKNSQSTGGVSVHTLAVQASVDPKLGQTTCPFVCLPPAPQQLSSSLKYRLQPWPDFGTCKHTPHLTTEFRSYG